MPNEDSLVRITRNGNVFLFKYYFASHLLLKRRARPASELFDQAEVEPVGCRKIDRHACAAAPDTDGAACALVVHIRGSREQRLSRQRSSARCDRLEKPQPFVIRLRDRAERRRVAAERRLVLASEGIVLARGPVDEIAGCAEQVFGIVCADPKQHGLVHRAG